MARRRIGRLVERQLLAQRRLYFVWARAFGLFAFRRQAAEGRFDRAGVNRVELLDIGDDLRYLGRKRFALVLSNIQMRQQGDLFNVGFGDRHKNFEEGLFTRHHGIASGNTILGGSNKSSTQFLIGD